MSVLKTQGFRAEPIALNDHRMPPARLPTEALETEKWIVRRVCAEPDLVEDLYPSTRFIEDGPTLGATLGVCIISGCDSWNQEASWTSFQTSGSTSTSTHPIRSKSTESDRLENSELNFTSKTGVCITFSKHTRMQKFKVNPVHMRLDTLLACGPKAIKDLALCAAGTVTAYRLVLGRCLLALDINGDIEEPGFSSSIHYARARLGLSKRQAVEARRVADQLRPFARLKLAAELGEISWSKLREIVRKATPETEEYWLKLAEKMTAEQIEDLVALTPKGKIPGAMEPDLKSSTTELRCRVCPEIFQLLRHARRTLAIQQDKAVSVAETLEWVLSEYLAGQPLDRKGLRRLQRETDKDLAAQYARTLPLVERARKLAEAMGVLEPESEDAESIATAETEVCPAQLRKDSGLNGGRSGASKSVPRKAINGVLSSERAEAQVEPQSGGPSWVESQPADGQGEPSRVEGRSAEDQSEPSRVATTATEQGDSEVVAAAAQVLEDILLQGLEQLTSPDAATLIAQALGAPGPESPLASSEAARTETVEAPDWAFWRNDRLCFNPKKRKPTRAQKIEILRRDGYECSTPGCPHFAWLHIHHIEPFAQGGPTSERNLLCLCSRCHKNVHAGRLVITRAQGELIFTDAKGRRLDYAAKLDLAWWLEVWLGWCEPGNYTEELEAGTWPLPPPEGSSTKRKIGAVGELVS